VRATPFKGGASQQWRLDAGQDGSALITSQLGKTLDFRGGMASDGARVRMYDVTGDANQRFMFRRLSGDLGAGNGGSGRTWFGQTRTIAAGASITVRNNEPIDAGQTDGRVFSGVVHQDVLDADGNVAMPRGSDAELMVKIDSNRDLVLDLESVTVNGQRYALTAHSDRLADGQKDGIGQNKRTAEYVGGGALLGTIIGAIAGEGKGAAIGAAAGAAAGAGMQVLTRGKAVNVPAESLLTFRLERTPRSGGSGTARSTC